MCWGKNTGGYYLAAGPEKGAKTLGSKTGGWLGLGAASGDIFTHTS